MERFLNDLCINSAWKVSVLRVFLVSIFPHLDWIRSDTLYSVGMRENSDQISYLSAFSPIARKYGPEKLRIQTLFTQCNVVEKFSGVKSNSNLGQ